MVGTIFKDKSSGEFKVTKVTPFKGHTIYSISIVKKPIDGEITIANPEMMIGKGEIGMTKNMFEELMELGTIKMN